MSLVDFVNELEKEKKRKKSVSTSRTEKGKGNGNFLGYTAERTWDNFKDVFKNIHKNAQINSRCKINISRCQDCKSDYCTLDSSVAPGYHIREGKPKTMRI